MSRRALRLIPVLFGLAACGADADSDVGGDIRYDTVAGIPRVLNGPLAGWDSAAAWRLEEDLRIGDREGAFAFASIRDVDVDAAGRIYLLDEQAAEVRVFDTQGAHLRTIGRSGSGPGEMRRPTAIAVGSDADVWVADTGRRLLMGFDSAGNLLHEVRRPSDRAATDLGIDVKGRIVEAQTPVQLNAASLDSGRTVYTPLLVRLDPSAPDHADTVRLPPYVWPADNGGRRGIAPGTDQRRWFTLPGLFAKAPQWVPDPEGFVWYASGESYTVHRISLEGDTLGTFIREVEPEPVPEAYRDSLLVIWSRMGAPGPRLVAETLPFFSMPSPFEAILNGSFSASADGRLWARRFGTGSAGAGGDARFDVFESDGRYLGEVVAPYPLELRPVPVVTESALYGVVRDELDVPYVVRLRIVRPGG